MQPLAVVVVAELGVEVVQVLRAHDHEASQAFAPEGLNEPLRECVEGWQSDSGISSGRREDLCSRQLDGIDRQERLNEYRTGCRSPSELGTVTPT